MKYIFVTGAPGSKWSSVVKNIYFSSSIDRSDYSDARTYYHDASGKKDLMHLGAYYDPGMEFGKFFDKLDNYTQEQCEQEFDNPFSGQGVKIVKSHVFAHHIDFIKQHWPDCPIVVVHRSNDSCLGWWVRCGHFDITYPSYAEYYKDLRTMSKIIDHQNNDILKVWNSRMVIEPKNNIDLAFKLGIKIPPSTYWQDYSANDIKVGII